MTAETRPSRRHDQRTPVWDGLRERFLATGNAAAVLAGRTALVDALVTSAWAEFLAPAFPRGMALVAVGGYGRRDLFPFSDVDLLLLVEQHPAGTRKEGLSAFLREMWDAGLRLSHSVRTPKECVELHGQNVELNISLLDQRFLAGDRELYQTMAERLPRFLRAQRRSLARHLCRLTRLRHVKHQDTIYHLEPNVKETPGGLRDFHLLHWLDRLREDRLGAPDRPDGIESSRLFLSSVRCFLHFRAGRDDNALSFDAQEEIAAHPFLPFDRPERWMREYFLHARSVHRAALRSMEASEGENNSLLQGFREWRSRLSNAELTVSRERVFLRSPSHIAYDPELVMRLFQFVARHGFRLAHETERRIADFLPVLERHYSRQYPHWAPIIELISLPHASMALAAMHETAVLGAIFPEWKRIECLVVRDFYHRYTVDEHTLQAIRNLEELQATQDPARRRFAELLGEIEQPALLRLALLFHDTGKGEGDGAHTRRSVALAEQGMERIQLPIRQRRLLTFLIEKHLELSLVIGGRDLEDPATARFLAATAGTVERLKGLALLTYADISAVNPGAMSPWRLEQLWRVYVVAYNELTRELQSDRIHETQTGSPETAAFLEGFPVRYLRTHTAEEIDRHLAMEGRCRQTGAAVQLERRNGVFELTVLAKDRPYLLASVAGALASFGLNIVKAEAFSNAAGIVLDTFTFEDPARNLELNPPEVERLVRTLEKVALGTVRARDLLKNRRTPPPPSKGSHIAPRVSFNHDASESATLIEIVAQDRPGLLYELSRAISEAGCNIEVVLLDTEAHRAIDVFYVTRNGGKLPPDEAGRLRTALLAAAGG
jgi:[protein-PII] uridylyltransferase